ncbi:thiamine pyrophosphate-dependent dehydrogenase E1 component subunit alpha [Nocardioides immobilis]|uniref:Thiamine pyrophosphate-dependent dehydrogenase E1 component subunit alpha n=2 Tax=Nocardioides immobilis TaxID=2049295 RepID=A0A417XX59_9ACTN|nr:thiamine pyrophosphate-dependent dehydrogenase E1 component subunit alpha [Nocardioides immobilis]
MQRVRSFELTVASLVKKGELPGAVHTSLGQEAEVVGACMALAPTDYMTGNHRSHGHPIGKGASLPPLMAELLGKSTGVCRGKGGSMHLADFSVGSLGESGVVGSAIPVATGAALSAHVLGNGRVALCFFGDGAANQGCLHESLNLAAIWKLPVIFLCENNQYASTTPARTVLSVDRVAQRASGYSIPGVTVEDGQDVLAVYAAVKVAVDRARRGEGPSIVEIMTYRYSEHSEGLLHAGAYRDAAERESWIARDPLVLHRARLLTAGVATEAELDQLVSDVEDEVASALEFAVASPLPEPAEAYADLFTTPIPQFGGMV